MSATDSYGGYRELAVSHQQLAFLREWQGESALVALNAAAEPASMELRLPGPLGGREVRWKDALDAAAGYRSSGGTLRLEAPPRSARILFPES